MKAKVFEVILHKLPSGKSPASQRAGGTAQWLSRAIPESSSGGHAHKHHCLAGGTERHAQLGRVRHHYFLHRVLHRIDMQSMRHARNQSVALFTMTKSE
jgi:hypothetical protein